MENFGSWSVITTNFLIILYLALGGVTFSSVLHLVNGKWRFEIRNIACALYPLFAIAGILLVILLVFGESTFSWLKEANQAHEEGDAAGAHHLPGWHNYTFLVARQIGGFLVVVILYGLFIKYQRLSEIDQSYRTQRTFRNIALLIPFAYFIYATMVAWDFEMTQLPGWHSASYGAYHFVSNFHMFLAAFTILLFILNSNNALKKPIADKIFNYMAQSMLAMTILFTYLYFTQYLIMWYGRLPDDMVRYNHMMHYSYAPLWWTFLALKFVIPFVTFAAYWGNRHNPPLIAAVAGSILIGTWIERYTWISGSVDPQYYHIPFTSVLDWVVTIVCVGAVIFTIRWSLRKNGLVKTS